MMGAMERTEVMAWVAAYERSWHEQDSGAVERLFTPEAHYRHSPYAQAQVGQAAIAASWADDEVFTMTAEPVAVEGHDAVVRVEVRYGDPLRQEYRDLWVLHFADDGRVADFEEWAYWPGSTYLAPGD